jgi:CysZ protein
MMSGMVRGLRAFLGGIGFICTTPAVWGYAAVPLAMMVIVLLAFTGLGVWGATEVSGAWLGHDAGFWHETGSWLVIGVLSVLSLLVALIIALVLAQPLSGLALERIVQAQEQALLGVRSPSPQFLASLRDSLSVALVTLIAGCVLFGPLLAISFLFPPTIVVTGPLKLLVSGWLLAWNFVDYPLTLRQRGMAERMHWVGRHFAAFTTFGLAWTLLLVVPGMVLLILPMGVAGATRLVVEAEGSPD